MSKLANLKLAMGISIFIAGFIFALFLFTLLFLLQLDTLSGLIVGLSGTGLFILFQYLIGPIIISAVTHLHYLKPGENPWLETTVKELADKSGVPMPRLATVPSKAPNAFVFGRTANSTTLAVHEGLLKNLNKDEIRAVIGHEIGHIKHKDYIVMTVLSALPLIAYIIAQTMFRAAMFSSYSTRRQKNEGNAGVIFLAIGAMSFVVYVITFLSVRRLSRLREHYADAFSAYLTGTPRSLSSALAKITYGLSIMPNAPSEMRAFYIEDPSTAQQEMRKIMDMKNEYDLDQDGVLDERELEYAMEQEAKSTWNQLNSLFATHPPTFKRILLLREIENEMHTGQYTSDRIYARV
ncbi:MAG: zinc metalloprotease HtpX [Candidatus Bathyarchaeota archaeon]|nr:zinc metalloprotease HtpX [Candidatus Bathyarchaeota archaeon]